MLYLQLRLSCQYEQLQDEQLITLDEEKIKQKRNEVIVQLCSLKKEREEDGARWLSS